MPCVSLCSASVHFSLFIFHFTLFLCFPLAGTLWMNWCMVAICAPCIPLLCLCSLLTFHISLFIFHFTLFLCFPLAGTLWMNWCMVAICALCIPLLCLFRETYARLELDAANQRARKASREPETQALLSSSSVPNQHADYLSGSVNSVV